MSESAFAALLEQWELHASREEGKVECQTSLFESDVVRIAALAELYHMRFEDVVSSLIHQALHEVETKMPYVPGDKVIRVEEGEEIYEDIGPMPRYLEIQRRLRDSEEKKRA